MYASSKTYPFSTYAVGEARARPDRLGRGGLGGRKFGLPVLALVGTVSAVAISFAVGDIEAPPLPAVPSGRSNQSDLADRSVERVAEPGFLFQLDSAQFGSVPERPGLMPPPGHRVGERVSSGLLRPSAALADRPKAAPLAAHLPRLGAAVPNEREPEVDPGLGGRPPALEARACRSDCSPATDIDAVDMSAEAPDDPIGGPGETVAPAIGRGPGDQAAVPSAGMLPIAPAPPLMADRLPNGSIVADTHHGMLAPPAATLAAVGGDSEAPWQENIASNRSSARELSEDSPARTIKPELELEHRGIAVLPAVETRKPNPARAGLSRKSRGPAAASSGATSPITAHLERIKERYSADEEFVDPGPGKVAAAENVRPLAAAPQGVSESSIVIHDNDRVGIKLGDLVSLFEEHFDRPLFVWMRSSSAASKYVSLATLAAAGIHAKFDSATQEVTFSVDD